MARGLRIGHGAGFLLAAGSGALILSGQAAGMTESAPLNTMYVRQGASGTGSGEDWANAFTALPATLQRGQTYYVADGSYSGYTFDDAVSGTTLITIKKATVADHGTSTGWLDTYGDGQASFTSWDFGSNFWLIDGQVKGADWFNGAAYGFQVGTGGSQDNQISFGAASQTRDSIAIQYVYVSGRTTIGTTGRPYAIDTDPFDSAIFHTNLRFSHIFVNGSNNPYFIRGTTGALIEYCANTDAWGNATLHGEVVNLYFTAENAILRYCHFRNSYLDGGGTAVVAIQDTNGHQIYGNVLENYSCGDGAIGFAGGNASNMKIYNNTFVKSASGGGGVAAGTGSGNEVRNNLFVGVASPSISVGSGATVTHNAFSNASGAGASQQVNVPTSIFVDYAGGNYRLASATDAGVTLAAPYDTDLLGNTRGTDAAWDRGAYEKI